MIRDTETPPEITRADAHTVMITIRHAGAFPRQQALAAVAADDRQQELWPPGLLRWSLFASTDGQALMAYEQWTDDEALDSALIAPQPYVPGVPGTEPSTPIRYHLHRAHVNAGEGARVTGRSGSGTSSTRCSR